MIDFRIDCEVNDCHAVLVLEAIPPLVRMVVAEVPQMWNSLSQCSRVQSCQGRGNLDRMGRWKVLVILHMVRIRIDIRQGNTLHNIVNVARICSCSVLCRGHLQCHLCKCMLVVSYNQEALPLQQPLRLLPLV